MKSNLNPEDYFGRIGYSGPGTATPGVLRELHRLHPEAIAFENPPPSPPYAAKERHKEG